MWVGLNFYSINVEVLQRLLVQGTVCPFFKPIKFDRKFLTLFVYSKSNIKWSCCCFHSIKSDSWRLLGWVPAVFLAQLFAEVATIASFLWWERVTSWLCVQDRTRIHTLLASNLIPYHYTKLHSKLKSRNKNNCYKGRCSLSLKYVMQSIIPSCT